MFLFFSEMYQLGINLKLKIKIYLKSGQKVQKIVKMYSKIGIQNINFGLKTYQINYLINANRITHKNVFI